MSDVIVYGFAPSTYVRTARLALEEKGVAYALRPIEFGSDEHLRLHPFARMPAFAHGDVRLYETSAITRYVDEAFDGPALQPGEVRARARMNQWISAVNDYCYADMARALVWERLVVPSRGGEPDEAKIAEALPRIEIQLDAIERELGDGGAYLAGGGPTLADLFLAPIMAYVRVTPEGPALLASRPGVGRWLDAMSARPSFAATEPPVPGSEAA